MATSLSQACTPATFNPSLFGADILAIQATVVRGLGSNITLENLDGIHPAFCNVTVSYTHPGQHDYITIEEWLPLDDWNGRFLAVGGGGWSPGRGTVGLPAMMTGLDAGFVTVATDAGLADNSPLAAPWALLSPGNVNLFALQNLMEVSLNDEVWSEYLATAVIGKSLIKSFYGRGPNFSYWNGCSQGGRQGLVMAQRYPTVFDGILANAPLINLHQVLSSIHWAYQSMLNVGVFPHEEEFDALTRGAISACDGLDGILDGVISDVETCWATFDPFSLVGTTLNNSIQITAEAAQVMNQTWHGIKTEETGERVWYGFGPGADLTGNNPNSPFVGEGVLTPLDVDCINGTCVGEASGLSTTWLQRFLLKDPAVSMAELTHADFDHLITLGERYRSMVATDDPDLSEFRKAGGKMITAHGFDDQLITHKGTEQYYKAVTALDPDVQDFYRYFEAPGLAHCFGGVSSDPIQLFDQLVAWVEEGVVPESTPVQVKVQGGGVHNRILCPFPKRAQLVGCDDPALAECWVCLDAQRGI